MMEELWPCRETFSSSKRYLTTVRFYSASHPAWTSPRIPFRLLGKKNSELHESHSHFSELSLGQSSDLWKVGASDSERIFLKILGFKALDFTRFIAEVTDMICFKPEGKILTGNTCRWITKCVLAVFRAAVPVKTRKHTSVSQNRKASVSANWALVLQKSLKPIFFSYFTSSFHRFARQNISFPMVISQYLMQTRIWARYATCDSSCVLNEPLGQRLISWTTYHEVSYDMWWILRLIVSSDKYSGC